MINGSDIERIKKLCKGHSIAESKLEELQKDDSTIKEHLDRLKRDGVIKSWVLRGFGY
jgi:predicted ArsR family transcriptional regulator